MRKILQITLIVCSITTLISCNQKTNSHEPESTNNPENSEQSKDTYLNELEQLNKDFFKNYWEIEKLVLKQLETEGTEYFESEDRLEILSKFESTLKAYCQLSEKLNYNNSGGLLTSYLHLNDTLNVKKQYELMRNEPNAFIYKEFHKYQDSDSILESKFIAIKYDKNVQEFATAVFGHVNLIEKFINQEWSGSLPPKIRVMLLNSDGPGPYNPDLNETFLPVKSRPLSSSMQVAGHIVHETFHLVNSNLFEMHCNFEIGMDVNSFKFLDEGYAQLVESKFMNNYSENRTLVNNYAKNLAEAKTFEFKELKTNWSQLFSNPDVNIYFLAYSFSYFLEDKFGTEELNKLFLPQKKFSESTWPEYVENHFGQNIDALIDEWLISLN